MSATQCPTAMTGEAPPGGGARGLLRRAFSNTSFKRLGWALLPGRGKGSSIQDGSHHHHHQRHHQQGTASPRDPNHFSASNGTGELQTVAVVNNGGYTATQGGIAFPEYGPSSGTVTPSTDHMYTTASMPTLQYPHPTSTPPKGQQLPRPTGGLGANVGAFHPLPTEAPVPIFHQAVTGRRMTVIPHGSVAGPGGINGGGALLPKGLSSMVRSGSCSSVGGASFSGTTSSSGGVSGGSLLAASFSRMQVRYLALSAWCDNIFRSRSLPGIDLDPCLVHTQNVSSH